MGTSRYSRGIWRARPCVSLWKRRLSVSPEQESPPRTSPSSSAPCRAIAYSIQPFSPNHVRLGEISAEPHDGDELRRVRVTGDLTLHGVTRSQTADVSVELLPDRLTAAGTLVVRQTDFGITPVTAGLGSVRVADEVLIEFRLVAIAGPKARSRSRREP